MKHLNWRRSPLTVRAARRRDTGASVGFRLRHFGPAPLINDASVAIRVGERVGGLEASSIRRSFSRSADQIRVWFDSAEETFTRGFGFESFRSPLVSSYCLPGWGHPAPFSYLDLNIHDDQITGSLVVHNFDAITLGSRPRSGCWPPLSPTRRERASSRC